MAPLDLNTLVAEWFDRQSSLGVDRALVLKVERRGERDVFVAAADNGYHESAESSAAALEDLCDAFRPRLEDLEATSLRVQAWGDVDAKRARGLLRAIAALADRGGAMKRDAHDEAVSALLAAIEEAPAEDRQGAIERALVASLDGGDASGPELVARELARAKETATDDASLADPATEERSD